MSLLSDDFFDTWVDWKIELYSAISDFALEPSEAHHDAVVKVLTEQAGDEVKKVDPTNYPTTNWRQPVIAICKTNRKRDALAIMGPGEYARGRFGAHQAQVNTWKCSKHTPQKMRGQWVPRKWSETGSGLYINRTAKFRAEHEVFTIPAAVYEALTTQFKHLDQ